MSTHPDGYEQGVAHPRTAPDSLVEEDGTEEDGVDHPVEPPSWLSNGSAPVATDQNAAAAGQEVPASRTPQTPEAPGTDSAAYAATSTFGSEDGYGHADPYSQSSLGQEGSYMPSSSSSYGFGQENPYSAGTEQPETESAIPPPPYPGLPYQRGNDTTAFRVPQARAGSTGAAVAPGQPRRASLVVARLEPWSVMKFSFLMSLVAWVVLFVAVALLYFVLSGLGVFHAVQTTLSGVTSSQGSGGFSLSKYVSASTVLGYTMLFGAINIVLITALSTIGSMIYNLVTHLGGGIEVTLRETD